MGCDHLRRRGHRACSFERLFEQVAELMVRPSESIEEQVYGLCRKYGLSFDRRWVPELESRFGPMRIV